MKMRTFTRATALLLAMALCVGCSTPSPQTPSTSVAGSSQPATDSSAAVSIVLMHDEAEEDRINTLQGIMDSFMLENPDVNISQLPVSEDSFDTKLKTFVASGEMPAIVAQGTGVMQMLEAEDMINTKANREVIDRIGYDKFYKPILDLVNSQDGAGSICVPITCWVGGVWYRKDLFAEKGLQTPDTWENILAAAKAFTDPAKKQYGIMIGTGENAVSAQHFQMLALSNGAELFDETGKPQFNSPKMKETMEFYKELYQYTLPGSNGSTEVRDAMVSGNSPMIFFSTYVMSALYKAGVAENVGYCIPEKEDKAAFGSPSAYTISNTISPEETQAAQRFIEFVLRKENNITMLHMAPGGPNPVIKEYATDPDYTDNELLQAYGDTKDSIAEGFGHLKVFGTQDGVTNPHMGTITNTLMISKAINQILVQGADLDATMEKTQQEMLEITGN